MDTQTSKKPIEPPQNETMDHRFFDVALWNTLDIDIVFCKLGKQATEQDINNVVNDLGDNFDASVGINWQVIEHAVMQVIKEGNNGN